MMQSKTPSRNDKIYYKIETFILFNEMIDSVFTGGLWPHDLSLIDD